MYPNLIPYGAIKSEFIARNLPGKECGRQFTDRTSGGSHSINIYYYYPLLLVWSVEVCVYLYTAGKAMLTWVFQSGM